MSSALRDLAVLLDGVFRDDDEVALQPCLDYRQPT